MKSDPSKLIKNFFKLENTPKDKAMAKKLQAALVREEYANGELICKKGEKAKAMFFIESGKVEIIGTNNQVLNELAQGAYFGEYAVLTGDKRLSSVRSKGGTVVYRLKSKDVFLGIRYKPAAYGDLIKQLYGQISSKHTKLLTLSSSRRGLVRDPKIKKNEHNKAVNSLRRYFSNIFTCRVFTRG